MDKVFVCFKHEKEECGWKEKVTFIEEDVLHNMCKTKTLLDALVLTDDSNIVTYCIQNNIASGVILHESNQTQSFPTGIYCMEKTPELDEDYLLKIYQRAKNIPWKILETDRLILREIAVEDVPRLYELYDDKSITEYMEDLFADVEEEKLYTKDYIKNIYHFYGYGIWLIILKETGEVIGRAGVESKDSMDGLELGFMLGTKYQHKGYAYEICSNIISYAEEELEETNIHAMVKPENIASRRLCERLDMHADGVLYDGHLMYKRK